MCVDSVSSGDKISSQALTLLRDLDNKQFHRFPFYSIGINYPATRNILHRRNSTFKKSGHSTAVSILGNRYSNYWYSV